MTNRPMREIKASIRVTGARRIASIEAAKRKVKDGQFYFIRRHGGYFRAGAHGYCHEVAGAGIFTAETARKYLDVEGLSVVPLKSMRAVLIGRIAEFSDAINSMRAMLYEPDSIANNNGGKSNG